MMKGILPCPLWLKQYFCKLFNTGLSLLILSPCNLYSLFILPCLFWIGDVECLCYFLISSNPFKLIAFQLPFWSFCLLSLSKRVHSIFMLRLFNDCVAMTLLHAALALVLLRRWNLGLIIFRYHYLSCHIILVFICSAFNCLIIYFCSFAVSIKMNILLYAPPLLLLMLKVVFVINFIVYLPQFANYFCSNYLLRYFKFFNLCDRLWISVE